MMNQDINLTQTIRVSTANKTIKSRLDLLYLTFLIEEDLEKRIKKIIPLKKMLLSDLRSKMINESSAKEFLDWNTDKYPGKIINKVKSVEYFYIDNFITNTTFGGLIKLLETLKDDEIEPAFKDLRDIVNWRVIKKWYENIKDLRNTLAHRSSIDMSSIFTRLATPAKPKNKDIFIDLSDVEKRKYIIRFFLFGHLDSEVERIFKKFSI